MVEITFSSGNSGTGRPTVTSRMGTTCGPIEEGDVVGLPAERRSGGDRHRCVERHRAGAGASTGCRGLSCRSDRPPTRGARGSAATIIAAGGTAVAAVADVGDRSALRAAIAEIESRLGPADVMVANAGFGAPTRLDPLNTPDVEQTIRVNVLGVIYSIEAVLPGMIARGRGHLLAVSSLAAFKGLPGESAYCASKAAVNAYMEGLRIALRPKGVVVTTVCPGFVKTPMTPMNSAATPFLMSADAAARRIARLIARRRGGVDCFPLPMVLLMSLIARLPDSLVARLVRVEPGPNRPEPNARRKVPDDRPGRQDAARREGPLRGHRAWGRLRRRIDLGPGGPVLRAAGECQHHHRTARRRPLGHGGMRRTSISATRSPRRTFSACGRSRVWHGPTT